MEPIEVVGARNVARPVVLLVASVNEDDPVLLPARVVKELRHLVAVGQLQAFCLEAGGKQLQGRVGLCGCGARHIGASRHRGRRRQLGPGEVVPGEHRDREAKARWRQRPKRRRSLPPARLPARLFSPSGRGRGGSGGSGRQPGRGRRYLLYRGRRLTVGAGDAGAGATWAARAPAPQGAGGRRGQAGTGAAVA